ncbi:hypothetical protein NW762_011633 [Fusarium torreyae]|uniref:Pathogenicity protein n=1 Tax=Fusarium torreyae TaxID=1237075 RepID=A0A9W8RQS8_9HYPO|nr:hypothetical protein NW762_011633 [Fusarium torreyae]
MKLSIASTLLLAQSIAAMPWSPVNPKANSEEITLRIQVSQGPSAGIGLTASPKGVLRASDYDICLKVCWPESPHCPEGWKPKKFGNEDTPCWTCCKSTGDDDL